jgi:hypothetical protein
MKRVQSLYSHDGGIAMNEETFNLSLRKFLKMVGVSSQNEIEKAVAKALAEKTVTGSETFPATKTLDIPDIGLKVTFNGNIALE